jgi:hypothetical protein
VLDVFDNVVVVVAPASVVVVVEVVGAVLPRLKVTVMTDGICRFPALAIFIVGASLV